jgi:flagellar hook-length control protein FliK
VPGPSATAAVPEPATVTRQVFPEVVRVAQSTTGTQRVTVRLQPEALGEVRVVLTSHRGELRVSFSAEGQARQAILEGAPELRRLLEAAGTGEARIVVRDLPGLATGSPSSSQHTGQPGPGVRQDAPGHQPGYQLGNQTGNQTGSQPGGDRQPPTNGRTTATDGTQDATTPSRRTDAVTRARAAGLDVTM